MNESKDLKILENSQKVVSEVMAAVKRGENWFEGMMIFEICDYVMTEIFHTPFETCDLLTVKKELEIQMSQWNNRKKGEVNDRREI